jgi:hypothetical protein
MELDAPSWVLALNAWCASHVIDVRFPAITADVPLPFPWVDRGIVGVSAGATDRNLDSGFLHGQGDSSSYRIDTVSVRKALRTD